MATEAGELAIDDETLERVVSDGNAVRISRRALSAGVRSGEASEEDVARFRELCPECFEEALAG